MTIIYLASDSPRRKDLMKQMMGSGFSILKNIHDEDDEVKLPPPKLAVHHAVSKALKASSKVRSGIVIAADTIVVCGKQVLGKPKDRKDAAGMLRKISNRVVRVITGVAVMKIDRGTRPRARTGYAITLVKIKKLSDREIDSYVKTREPLDKAGAFAIQGKGAFLVEWIKGDYDNVVGLPIKILRKMLGAIHELPVRDCHV